jgi:hypothetical protein
MVAPNGTVVLASLNGAEHIGSFFGKNIEVHQGNIIRHTPFRWWTRFGNGVCVPLTSAEINSIQPFNAADFFRFCSSGVLTSGTSLPRPDIFSQLHVFEGQMRSAESTVQTSLKDLLDATTFLADPIGLPPARTIEQADADSAGAVNSAVQIIANRDQAAGAAISAIRPNSPTDVTTAALAAWWASTRAALWIWYPPRHFDSSCEDVVRNEIGLDLAESLARDDLPGYVNGMERLTRALACTSAETTLNISEAFVLGIDDALGRFPATYRLDAQQALFSSLLS